MLHAFITENRDELIARARERVAGRKIPRATQPELDLGVPLFLNHLAALLEETMTPAEASIARAQTPHTRAQGRDFLANGVTVAQAVQDYGDVCLVVTELAAERKVVITPAELHSLQRCVDDAIAQAVDDYSGARERSIAAQGVEHLGVLAHELRNVLSTAMLSFDAIKSGIAKVDGSVGAMHTRSLLRLRDLIDSSLTEVRLDAEMIKHEQVVVAEFIEEAVIAATFQARAHSLELFVAPVEIDLRVHIDRQVLAGALANLLQNAFKFTRAHSLVSLTTHATRERVTIDVEDQCGGLPAGAVEGLFRPFEQRSLDRSGLGLGLSIARRAVQANGGELRVLDIPRVGCRFTIDLPRVSPLISAGASA